MKATEKLWNEAETYKSVTFAMIRDAEYREKIVERNGYTYFTINFKETNFNYRVRAFRGDYVSYYDVKVGNKWIDFNDFDWEC